MDRAAWDALTQAHADAYWEAVNGRGPVPGYRVSTDPVDGSFVALPDKPPDPLGTARMAGDCRRRFLAAAAPGGDGDGFADIRVPWPGSPGGAGGDAGGA